MYSFPRNVNLKTVREPGDHTALSAALCVFILQRDHPSFIPGGQFSPQALGNRSSPQAICNPRQAAFEMRMHNSVSRCSEAPVTPFALPHRVFLKSWHLKLHSPGKWVLMADFSKSAWIKSSSLFLLGKGETWMKFWARCYWGKTGKKCSVRSPVNFK